MSSSALIPSGQAALPRLEVIRTEVREGLPYALVQLTDEGDRALGRLCGNEDQRSVFAFPRHSFLVRLKDGVPVISEGQVCFLWRTMMDGR